MHVGLNLVYLVPGETGGMEVVARELIPALVAERPGWRFTSFVNREAAADAGPWGELTAQVTVPVRARRRTEWVRGEQLLLPGLARRAGVQLLHSLASTAPAFGRFTRVVTVHDLIYKRYPEAHGGLRALGMGALVPLAARRAHRVLADSESTKADLVSLLRIGAERIEVVPLGVRPPSAAATPEATLRQQLGLGDRPVLLTVGATRPHKNLARLLDAIAAIPAPARPVLVVTGYATEHEASQRSRIEALGLAGDTRLLGWVPSADLDGLYELATTFVFPSLYEGFGLPVLEAMIRGVPVACSRAASLPEVAGDAAVLFDPERTEEISAAITRLLDDHELRARLSSAGRAQASQFTWRRTAAATVAAYERARAAAGRC